MSKIANANAKSTSPSKSKSKGEKLEKVNIAKAAVKVEVVRESKYAYPGDVTTAKQKKVFRRNARAAKVKLEKMIGELKASNEKKDQIELKRIQKEMEVFNKETYAVQKVA